MEELTQSILRAADRLDENARERARREHDVRLMTTLAEHLRASATEHVADADSRCVTCAGTPWPCDAATRWGAIAEIALEERQHRG
jgi:hypothetical protein